jgi:Thiol-disulfide isomerase and thioredoxins
LKTHHYDEEHPMDPAFRLIDGHPHLPAGASARPGREICGGTAEARHLRTRLQTNRPPTGKTIQFSDFAKGKYVVIDFWASWCPDCRKDMPEVIRMYNKWHKMGVEFLGVSFDTDKQKWTDYIAQSGVPYTQVSEMKRMNQSEVAKAYGVRWIPSSTSSAPTAKCW